MRCINPITLKNDTVVPCGYCGNCVRRKQQDWLQRLQVENFHSFSSHFVTLTYSDAHLPYFGGSCQLNMSDTQKFLKRLRKFQDGLFDGLEPIRYYLVGEYGERTGRAHYHVLFFNLIPQSVARLEALWGLGRIHIGKVSGASISYVTSYVITRYHYPCRVPPFLRCPRSLGLGINI